MFDFLLAGFFQVITFQVYRTRHTVVVHVAPQQKVLLPTRSHIEVQRYHGILLLNLCKRQCLFSML